jgi:hypothetical protein
VGTVGQREGDWAHTREPAPTGPTHGVARERGREGALRRAPTGGAHPSDTGGGHVRRRARGAGPACAKWAEMAFSISREFLISFLFIFSRVFNSNSNQVSNSSQIKYMQQFKEYLDSI